MAPVPERRAQTAHLCERLLRRWDPMFSGTSDPTRGRRTDAILATPVDRFSGPFRILELGSGPGPLTERMLERFPQCQVVALDTDPVLLKVGEVALRHFQDRTTWVLTDLRDRDWPSALPFPQFDTAVSSLTLHWLEEREIRTLYRDLHELLRPRGLLVEGDFLPVRPSGKPLKRPSRTKVPPRGTDRNSGGLREFKDQWGEWWDALASASSMRASLRERRVRLPGPVPPRRTSGPKTPAPLESHVEALRDAGFQETVVVWQDQGFRVLVAVR